MSGILCPLFDYNLSLAVELLNWFYVADMPADANEIAGDAHGHLARGKTNLLILRCFESRFPSQPPFA